MNIKDFIPTGEQKPPIEGWYDVHVEYMNPDEKPWQGSLYWNGEEWENIREQSAVGWRNYSVIYSDEFIAGYNLLFHDEIDYCQINTQNSDKKELPEGLHEYLYGVIDEAKEALKNEPSKYTQNAIFMLARKDLAEMILLRLPDLKTKQP